MPNIGHVISVGDVLATLCLGRVERLGDNFRDLSLPGHSLPLTAVGAMFVIMGMGGKLTLPVAKDQCVVIIFFSDWLKFC